MTSLSSSIYSTTFLQYFSNHLPACAKSQRSSVWFVFSIPWYLQSFDTRYAIGGSPSSCQDLVKIVVRTVRR